MRLRMMKSGQQLRKSLGNQQPPPPPLHQLLPALQQQQPQRPPPLHPPLPPPRDPRRRPSRPRPPRQPLQPCWRGRAVSSPEVSVVSSMGSPLSVRLSRLSGSQSSSAGRGGTSRERTTSLTRTPSRRDVTGEDNIADK